MPFHISCKAGVDDLHHWIEHKQYEIFIEIPPDVLDVFLKPIQSFG